MTFGILINKHAYDKSRHFCLHFIIYDFPLIAIKFFPKNFIPSQAESCTMLNMIEQGGWMMTMMMINIGFVCSR